MLFFKAVYAQLVRAPVQLFFHRVRLPIPAVQVVCRHLIRLMHRLYLLWINNARLRLHLPHREVYLHRQAQEVYRLHLRRVHRLHHLYQELHNNRLYRAHRL